jgi:hypothetical protein
MSRHHWIVRLTSFIYLHGEWRELAPRGQLLVEAERPDT